jgi:hypothetical protein
MLRLLDISNLSRFHQCPTECTCMFSLEDGSEIVTAPAASEFLGSTVNISDGDSALEYYVRRRTIPCR